MKIFKDIPSFKNEIGRIKKSGKTIGFVPTMGNLHEGHLSLLKECRRENDISVLSIYVNPTQFGPNEDFKKYPRTLERDLELAKKSGCDLVLTPSDKTMYPEGFSTYVIEENLSIPMEGKKRPGHFKGVLTIVTKLFNIVEPDIAYFGQKDAQQAILIKKLVEDLNINTQIKVMPTLREASGLAMSSRNNYLSKKERAKASIIYRSLKLAEDAYRQGERDTKKLLGIVKNVIARESSMVIDYVEIRSMKNLAGLGKVSKDSLLAISVKFKCVHLVDNIVLKVKAKKNYL